jgi:hemerythrin
MPDFKRKNLNNILEDKELESSDLNSLKFIFEELLNYISIEYKKELSEYLLEKFNFKALEYKN